MSALLLWGARKIGKLPSHGRPDEAEDRSIDWAVDFTQIGPIVLLPIAGLIFLLPNSDLSTVVTFILSIAGVAGAVLMLAVKVERYGSRWLWGWLTPLSTFGLALNLIIWGGILAKAHGPIPAKDLVSIEEPVTHVAAGAYTVYVNVPGGVESLGKRQIWIANGEEVRVGESATAQDLSYANAPCAQMGDIRWECRDIYLGQNGKQGVVLKVFALLVDNEGLSCIATEWAHSSGSGFFRCSVGVDATTPVSVTRT